MSIKELYRIFLEKKIISTDTRKIEIDCIFFALKGANFNGNTFAKEALNKGAAYVVIDEVAYKESDRTILVDDVLQCLQQLAAFHRKNLDFPILSLTGSNGKTTTKELINAVLSQKFKTIATKGNLNNHIGVPLTLLSMDHQTEFGIVEMGANHQKEIEFLCSIAQPDFGCITNFGKAHLEGFGGVEGVIKGKSELYDFLMTHKKTVFFNLDDRIQAEKLADYKQKFNFSYTKKGDVQIELITSNPFVILKVNEVEIKSHLIGSYNANNIAMAVCTGLFFEVPLVDIKTAIEKYVPVNNRSQLIEKESNQIILDAYNANPSSMEAALKNLDILSINRKVAFLGDMFELGNDAPKEHQRIAEQAESLTRTTVYLIGEHFSKTTTSSQKFKTFEELKEFLLKNPLRDSTVLIKGSRGMALERVLEII